MNNWQLSLTVDEAIELTENGYFEMPFMPSYCSIAEISPFNYHGEIGYGNGTAHTMSIILRPGANLMVIQIYRGGTSNLEDDSAAVFTITEIEGQLAWERAMKRMGFNYEYDAHLFTVMIKRWLKRIKNNEPGHWERIPYQTR